MTLSRTSFFATSIHIEATSTRLSQTPNIHCFFLFTFVRAPLLVLLNTL